MSTKQIEINVKTSMYGSISRLRGVANRMAWMEARMYPGLVEVLGTGWIGYDPIQGTYRYGYEIVTRY